MKRYQSAFAAPSGFVVSAGPSDSASRRGESAHRGVDVPGLAPASKKVRPIREIRDRAA